MSDTVKIPRPKFARRKGGPNGRAQHDERGNAIWVRTRASDSVEAPIVPDLSLVDDAPKRSTRASGAVKVRKPG